MRNWVKWCINHNLKWVLYIILVCMFPIYVFSYIKEGYMDWVSEVKWVKDS